MSYSPAALYFVTGQSRRASSVHWLECSTSHQSFWLFQLALARGYLRGDSSYMHYKSNCRRFEPFWARLCILHPRFRRFFSYWRASSRLGGRCSWSCPTSWSIPFPRALSTSSHSETCLMCTCLRRELFQDPTFDSTSEQRFWKRLLTWASGLSNELTLRNQRWSSWRLSSAFSVQDPDPSFSCSRTLALILLNVLYPLTFSCWEEVGYRRLYRAWLIFGML